MKLHFTSNIIPKAMDKLNELIRLWNSTSKSIATTNQDNWSELLPLAEFTYNNTPSATTGITTLLWPTRVIIQTSQVHLEHNLASACTHDFVTDLDELHKQLGQHIANAQCRYQTSTDSQWLLALEFKIGSHVYVKRIFFHMTQPSKKLSDKIPWTI